MKKICIIPHCKNEITGHRLKRKYVTCANPSCSYLHNLNAMTIYRAKEIGKETKVCSSNNCGRHFVMIEGTSHGKCTQCRKGVAPRERLPNNRTPRPVSYYDRISAGKMYVDVRKEICARDGKLCANYVKCTDTICIDTKGGLFKYKTNGGVNCWENPESRSSGHLRSGGLFQPTGEPSSGYSPVYP